MTEQIDSDQITSGEEQSQQQAASKKMKKTSTKNKGKIMLNISDCQYPVVSRVAKSLGWKLQANAQAIDWDVLWTDNAVQPETLLKMEPYQKINHFPGMFNLARKNLMGRYLMKMRKKFADDYSFFPMTWMLPVQYHQLKSYFETKQKGKARTFIVKPQALSQGKGIYLTRKLQQIDQNAHCVVQRYMHRPYLIQGLKFDMRVYVLVASVDPLRLYIYYEGLTRFATQKYEAPTKDNMEDVCMHLTNYAINKDNPKFVFNSSSTDMSKGHKRSLTWLFQYLQKNEPNCGNLKQKIQDMIVKTMISGLPVITNTYRSCQPQNYASNMCFELLGFDVMLTDKCEPVLLQINHTPSFTTDTPLDDVIKTNYIKDSLVLMNINQKTKEGIVKQRKQACQQRVITGKKIKLTNDEKQMQRKKAHAEREKYQEKHLGGFKKIFPLNDEQKMSKYEQFLNFSQQNYLISTGTKRGSFQNKKGQKIESAFGTCFKPKENAKALGALKTKTTGSQINKKVPNIQRKYETKKIIGELNAQNQKRNLTHSQNLISPKSLGQCEQYELRLAKFNLYAENNESEGIEKQFKYSKHSTPNLKISEQQQNKKINLTGSLNMSNLKVADNSQVQSNLLSRKTNCIERTTVDIIHEQTQQSSQLEMINSFENKRELASSQNYKNQQPKNKKGRFNSTLNNKQNLSQIQRQHNQRNMNNVQIFFDSDILPSNYDARRRNQQTLSNCNQNTSRKNQHLKFGIFGVNQITSDIERKKQKTPSLNPKSASNIQNWQSRGKERHLCNRQKIPILLNTLLIGSSEGAKPAVSANNLRKILNSQK